MRTSSASNLATCCPGSTRTTEPSVCGITSTTGVSVAASTQASASSSAARSSALGARPRAARGRTSNWGESPFARRRACASWKALIKRIRSKASSGREIGLASGIEDALGSTITLERRCPARKACCTSCAKRGDFRLKGLSLAFTRHHGQAGLMRKAEAIIKLTAQ